MTFRPQWGRQLFENCELRPHGHPGGRFHFWRPPIFSLPTRGRPDKLARFLDGYTTTGAAAPVRMRLDQDDPDLDAYLEIILPPSWVRVIRPRVPGGANAAHAEMLAEHPDLDWYGLLADDVIPRTDGWDKALLEAAGKDKLAYADDGFQGANLATHPVLGGDLVRAIGWICCPAVGHNYADTCLHLIAQKSGRDVYLPHVKLEHMHPLAGKAKEDATHRYAQDFVRDTWAFYKWRGRSLRPIVERLKAA